MKNIRNKFKENLVRVLMLSFVLTAIFACGRNDNNEDAGTKKTFVLVHGAWQASFVWDEVKLQLEKQGYNVIAVELPAHGKDQSPLSEATLSNYVERVKAIINTVDGKVVLVGHSLGGAIITQTASVLPEKIEKLVYIAGFVPGNGESVNDLSVQDTGSEINLGILVPSADFSTITFADPQVNIPKIFCHDGSQEQQTLLVNNLRPEPTAPMGTALNYDPAIFAKINKYYIYTKQDRAISYGFQQKMVQKSGITQTFEIDASHSPFVSKPSEVSSILNNLAK